MELGWAGADTRRPHSKAKTSPWQYNTTPNLPIWLYPDHHGNKQPYQGTRRQLRYVTVQQRSPLPVHGAWLLFSTPLIGTTACWYLRFRLGSLMIGRKGECLGRCRSGRRVEKTMDKRTFPVRPPFSTSGYYAGKS